MLKLLSIEMMKTRRSLALLMMFAIPLFVVALNLMILVKRSGIASITEQQWFFFWSGSMGMWCYFMMPLYIALVTGLLNGQEHKNQTWRLMLTLPISQTQLFLVKSLLAWLFVMGATLVIISGNVLAVELLGLLGANVKGAYGMAFGPMLAKTALTCVPVLLIQHAVSWRFQNLVAPLALGAIATMGITQIGSSKDWIWYPWSYPMMALLGSDPSKQQEALWLAAAVGLVLLAASAAWLGRRQGDT